VAVNVELREADLTPLDVEEVVASLQMASGDESGAGRESLQASRLRSEDQERRQSVWRFLLVLALMLLAVETVVSNRISRAPGRRELHAGT
jgi:hypothetical protein